MANFYYEISDCLVKRYSDKYYVVHSRHGDSMMAAGYKITLDSERIWKEDSIGVRFVKNRHNITHDVDYNNVDLKEFMWIKLKAESIRG